MEALVALALPCVLAVLAARWGSDSRESLRSKEEELAALGYTWGPPPTPAGGDVFVLELAAQRVDEYRREAAVARLVRPTAARRRPLRGRLAALLTAVANWLDPEPTGAEGSRAAVRPLRT